MRANLVLAVIALGCASPAATPSDRLALLNGYQPETVVRGPLGTLYLGTLTGGGIEAVDLETRTVRFVVPPTENGERVIAGIAYDEARHQIVACGAWLSTVWVLDADSGAILSEAHVPSGLVNAVALRGDDAYFTESVHPSMYRATRDASGLFAGDPIVVSLGGDFASVAGLMELNSNGIVAPPGRNEVVIAHSALGALFRVDPATGDARRIAIDGGSLVGADGLVLEGTTLLVVRNGAAGGVTRLELEADLASAHEVASVDDPRFRSPTSAARAGDRLWVLSSRLLEIFHGHTAPDDTFELVAIPMPGGGTS